MNELVAALTIWIGANSSCRTAGLSLPEAVTMNSEAQTVEAYAHVPEMRPADGVDERLQALRAFEDGAHGTVYVLDCCTRGSSETGCGDPRLRECLLHELVHHVQYRSGVYARPPCRAVTEKEARLLGGRYLAAEHVTDPLPNRNFRAHIYSRC